MRFSYEEVLDKIMNARRFGNRPGAEVTARLLSALGCEFSIPYIHVAGTNGKGSVCAFLRSIMREAGIRTGCFISPHLVDFRERITADGEMIDREAVTRLGNRLLALSADVTPTMFDYCLLLAVLWFQEQGCELAVIETGLGGRLDSTNALGTPAAAVITRIGYDHMAILGDNLAEIASEKAGILKPGVPAVFAPQEEAARAVLFAGAENAYMVTEEDIRTAADWEPGLPGAYQYENAAAAAAAARLVLPQKLHSAIPAGIRRARWPGRMQLLSAEPFLLVDGAHNSTGAEALRESLAQQYPGERFCFVMGVMADKDYERMADILRPVAEEFVTVTPPGERALPAEALAERLREMGFSARCLLPEEDLMELAAQKKRTAAIGSLYLIGSILEKYGGRPQGNSLRIFP